MCNLPFNTHVGLRAQKLSQNSQTGALRFLRSHARGNMADTAMYDPLLPVGGEQYVSPVRRKANDQLRKFRENMQELCPKKMLVLVLIFGCGTGVVAWVYNSFFEAVVHFAWELLPEKLIAPMLNHLSSKVSWFPTISRVAWVYTVLLSTLFGFLAGLTQRLLGSPGDLPDTVRDIHEQGYISIGKAPSMFLCSTFSICAGGSLGPEAPLLALCGATTSWFGRKVLRYKGQKLRNCALLGRLAQVVAALDCQSTNAIMQACQTV